MNWKLVQPNDGEPEIDRWDTTPRSGKSSTLDVLYDLLQERGQADGIEKLGPGRYLVPKRWLDQGPCLTCGQDETCTHGGWISGAC